MTLEKGNEMMRRGLLAAILFVLGLTAVAVPSSANAEGAKPTVVLVHGVFADSSGWNPTIAALQAAGFPVIAAANPLRDLEGDAAYVSSIVDTIPGPVIMVGHSYGGAVITDAANGHDNVKALVYVAALAPDQGESPLQLSTQFGLSGHSGAPAWKAIPSWYVIPTADKVIPPAAQRFMAERAGSKVREAEGASHAVMISRPDTVVRQILSAYYATR
ncbi:alpha/beta fold hydrolase [Nonomuraea sp. SYSU D8015]|uniref:alpha/beta fold hydrolase n=1 Tax=Nonomuraea sp. SYSU D8015 TaxID=2593644 RepID=UPI001CB6D3A5|nr:alpha/beta hydrolase [Nonomuraea sp. SYSU D8015]